MLEFTWGGPEVDVPLCWGDEAWPARRRPRRARRVDVHVLVPVRSRGCKAPARERGGVACSSLFSSRRRPGREEASPARRRPRRSALGEARRFTSWFPCAVGAVKRVPGREEAWPARRSPQRPGCGAFTSTSWFPCAVVAVKRLPGREEAWPARRCSRRGAAVACWLLVADLLTPLRRVCVCLRVAPANSAAGVQ